MDILPAGSTSNSIIFALNTGGVTVTDFKLSYTRYTRGDGESFTQTSAQLTAPLATFDAAFSVNKGIYISSIGSEGAKFLFRADVPDAAFLPGADEVVISIYDDATETKAQRIIQLKGDVVDMYNGQIWLDTNNGSAGSVKGVNGTANNPVDNIADALLLCSATDIYKIHTAQRSGFNIPATLDTIHFVGQDYFINLSSQELNSVVIEGAWVAGDATTNDDELTLIDCIIGLATLPPARLFNCKLTANIILYAASSLYVFDKCSGMYPDSFGTHPGIDYDAANITVIMTGYEGLIEVSNLGGNTGHTLELTGNGEFIENASCVSGSPKITGDWKLTAISNLTPNADTNSGVNITRINDELTDGYNAHLKLKTLNVENNAGTAVSFRSAGGDGDGLEINGEGFGEGLKIRGGSSGDAIQALGGSASGAGMRLAAQGGDSTGLVVTGIGNGDAMQIIASPSGNGSGLDISGSAAGADLGAKEIAAIQAKTDKLPHSVKKNTAIPYYYFVMFDATTGDPKPSLTITAWRRLDAAVAWSAMTGTISPVSDGVYRIAIAAEDTNGGGGAWRFTAPGAKVTIVTFLTEE